MTRISSGYSAYSADALTQLLSAKSKPISKQRTPESRNNTLPDSSGQNALVNKIEKHINDVKRGNGDISKDVAFVLGAQDSNANDILSKTNPRALALYSGYLSGLRYDRAARFVNAIEYGLRSLSRVGKTADE